MVFNDRLKRAFYALFKASVPRLDYFALYSAKVVTQGSAPNALDLQPDDSRIPPMGGVPIRHGLPGVSIHVTTGSTVLVGWENGDPSRPFCALWQGAEDTAARITVVAQTVELGGSSLDPIQMGALNGQAVDPYTGLQHWQLGNASQTVMVKK